MYQLDVKPFFILITSLWSTSVSIAQKQVKAFVVDILVNPVSGVDVRMVKAGRRTITDLDGVFRLKINPGDSSDTVSISGTGLKI